VAASFRARLERARAALDRLDRRGAWVANFRGATFAGALVAAGLSIYEKLPRLEGWGLAGLLMAGYVALAVWHQAILSSEGRERLRVQLNERGLARLDGGWHAFPNRGERYLDPEHPYAPDLDLFGQGSLFQLIDESGTRRGEERLASWLSAPAPAEVVRARQRGSAELAGLLDFRQELLIESRLASKEKADPARFIAWAEGESLLAPIRWAQPLGWALPAAFAASACLASFHWIPSAVPWACFISLLAVAALTRKRLQAMYEAIRSSEGGFVRFENAFRLVEGQRFEDATLQATAQAVGVTASASLAAFSRRFSFAELRQSAQMHAVIHILTLWDVHWLFSLERWRARHGSQVRAWFDALAELEALSSIAGLAHVRPEFRQPAILEDRARLVARGLGHPLLDAPIRNDVALPEPGNALVITGSNMSGKTTLLRAMGANAVLALAGAPVCADAFEVGTVRVLTGMRVKDSLERGVSYFYAEVQRIKLLLSSAREAHGRALFLLDEILLGTNARERQVASREILRLLLQTGAIGAVATHDLTLSTLAEARALQVKNAHFEDQISEGKMTFDYRLRDGIVQGTNALRVLREAGIEVEDRQP
jgi:hypothetical protein